MEKEKMTKQQIKNHKKREAAKKKKKELKDAEQVIDLLVVDFAFLPVISIQPVAEFINKLCLEFASI